MTQTTSREKKGGCGRPGRHFFRHEVITRFPAGKLLVAGRHYFTVDGPLPAIRETETKPSVRVKEMIEASAKQERVAVPSKSPAKKARSKD